MTAQENDNPTPESQNDEGGAIDQGDIDSMFGSDAPAENADAPGAESAQSEPQKAEELVDGPPPIDQASIDAMFGGGDTEKAADAAAEPAAEDAGPAAVDQADIDAMFGGDDAAAEPVAKQAEESGPAAVDQSDIDAMFGGDDSGGETGSADEAPAPPDERLDTLGRPFDAAAAEMAAAIAEEKEAAAAAAPPPPPPAPPVHTEAVSLEDFGSEGLGSIDPKKVTMLSDVKLRVRVELGRSRMLVEDVLQLGEGSVVELQKAAGDPVDIIVNERLIARGEVLVLNDNFCVRISEIVATDPHRVTV